MPNLWAVGDNSSELTAYSGDRGRDGSFLGIGFPQTTAQYVRVQATTTSATANWWSIAELNVWTGAP